MSKSNNDILAEYVRKKYPEIPRTIDFAFYSFAERAKELGENLKETFSKPLIVGNTEISDEQHESD